MPVLRDLIILKRRNPSESPSSNLPATQLASAERIAGREALVVLDQPHAIEEARGLFGDRFPISIDGLLWIATDAPLPSSVAETYSEKMRIRLDSKIAWCASATESADAADVVKQVSFLHASSGTNLAEFRAHYRDHVALARKHMPALWQYVQNDVVDMSGDTNEAAGVVVVSELWFRTTDDFLQRYFPSDEDRRAFSAQEGFLDLTKATSFVCTSHQLIRDPGID